MATKVKTGVIDAGAITSALITDASITADDLHTTLDLTGKTVTVATASASDNDTSVASTAYVTTALANLADSAPSTLNTLNELAAALGDDANYATTTTNAIATKLPLAGGTLTGALTGTSFNDGYVTWSAAQFNRYGAAIELQFTPTNTATLVKIGSNGSNPTIFNAHSGDASFAGNVGIGTTGPSTPLHVIKLGNPNSGGNRNAVEDVLTLEATGYYPYSGYGVGINFQGEDYGNSAIRDYGKIQAVMETQSAQTAAGDAGFTSQLGFWTNSGGASSTLSTQKMTINSTGHVGIGTASPDATLHIKASSPTLTLETSANSNNPLITLKSSGGITNEGAQIYYDNSVGTLHLTTTYANDAAGIKFHTATATDRATNNERMVIGGNGHVGIGITNPSSLLHIQSNNSTTNDAVNMMFLTALSTGTTTTGFGPAIVLQAERNSGVNQNVGKIRSVAEVNSGTNISSGLSFETGTAGVLNERMRITHGGDLLVGSSTNLNVLSGTPKIQIGKGDGHSSMQFYSGTSHVGALYFGDDSSANNNRYRGYLEYRHSGDVMAFRAAGQDALHLGDGSGGKTNIMFGAQAWSETTQGVGKGQLHFDPDTATDHHGSAITFGASDSGNGLNAQAGIYTRSDGSYGSKMYLSTSDSYGVGSKTAIKIDQAGRVTMPRQPGFFARGNTSQWLNGYNGWNKLIGGIANANGTQVGVNLTEANKTHLNGYDTGSDFNITNGRFTAPVEGKYHIHGSIYCMKNGTNGNDYIHFLPYVNGQYINEMYTMGGHGAAFAHDFSLNISSVLYLEAYDYVEWYVYFAGGTNMRIYGDHLSIGANLLS